MNRKILLLISILSFLLLLGGCPIPINVAICGNEICESGESTVCPSDCTGKTTITPPPIVQSCTDLGGKTCGSSDMCAGYWLDSGYTCCSKSCENDITQINFQKGWNYVSFPEVQLDDAVEDIFAGNFITAIDSIYTYDDGKWKVWHSDTSIPGDLDNIEGGRAYIFVMKSDYTLQISDLENTLQTLMKSETSLREPTTIKVKKGWNLIGTAANSEHPHEEYLWSIDGDYESMWMFTTTQGGLEKIDLTHDYNLVPTRAYWIYLTADGEITP